MLSYVSCTKFVELPDFLWVAWAVWHALFEASTISGPWWLVRLRAALTSSNDFLGKHKHWIWEDSGENLWNLCFAGKPWLGGEISWGINGGCGAVESVTGQKIVRHSALVKSATFLSLQHQPLTPIHPALCPKPLFSRYSQPADNDQIFYHNTHMRVCYCYLCLHRLYRFYVPKRIPMRHCQYYIKEVP